MTEIKFPSIVGITLNGLMIVRDSKGKERLLKKFYPKSGRKLYHPGEYYGVKVTRAQFSVPVDSVPSFERWKEKQKK